MSEKKPYEPSPIAANVLAILRDANRSMTLAEINAIAVEPAKPGHVSTLIKQHLIVSEDVELTCPHCGHTNKVKSYRIA